MKLRLVRDSAAFEWPLDDSVLLIAPAVFSFFYALAADRDGRQQPAWAAGQKLSKLARDAWAEIQQARTPLGEEQLRQQLGKGISEAALRRALHELWQRLRIMRVDRTAGSGDIWDALSRCALQPIREAEQLSVPSALSALLSKYLYATVAAEPKEVEQFFSPLVARSKVRDATSALLAAREISPIQVGSHSMLQLTPAKAPFKPKQVNVAAPAAVPRRVALRPSSGRPQR
jgi:hypothetical protein